MLVVVNKSYVLFPVTLDHLDISDGKLGQSCGQCSTDEKFTVHQELAHGRSAKNTRQNFYIPSLQSRNSRNPSRLNKLLEWTLYTIGTSRLCLGVGSSVQWEGLLKCQQQRKLPSLVANAYTVLLAITRLLRSNTSLYVTNASLTVTSLLYFQYISPPPF